MSSHHESNENILFTPFICKSAKSVYPEVKINSNDYYTNELFETTIAMSGFISKNMNDDKTICDIMNKLGDMQDYILAKSGANGIAKIIVFFNEIYQIDENINSETDNDSDKKYVDEYVYDEVKDKMFVVEKEIKIENNSLEENTLDDNFHYQDGCYYFNNGLHQVELFFY
jgi:hypothetical protein